TLPGLGSYVQLAVDAKDMRALGLALLTMAIVIVLVDQLFWRPIVAWSDKFRLEQSAAAAAPSSWMFDLVKAANIPEMIGRAFAPLVDATNAFLRRLTKPRPPRDEIPRGSRVDRIYNLALAAIVAVLVVVGLNFILTTVGIGEVFHVISLGFATLARVFVLLIFATLIWTPVGVAIGFNPRLAQVMQPVVQFLASFPANFVFPFATLFFIGAHIDINYGCILLMALGSQWYILFNAIAGAQSIPTELREMATDFQLQGWKRWQKLIIPGIFGSWVTGAITASGGAWNASIVSEVVSWGNKTLTAFGLGSYVADATGKGDWPRITLGVSVMSLFVVIINRTLWRRLYALAERKFQL
ncbi:MAG TPA: ABC transporter permease subunit, partial [Candidatus Baltobacteraceae bacterium]|nr:ABC transporter permease subunit [Candidatus Baltobacteraceae bacterium]